MHGYSPRDHLLEREAHRKSRWQHEHNRKLLDNAQKIIKASDQMGLFWEFVRYFNCEWTYSYLMDQIGSTYFDKYHRFDLEDLANHTGFEENINEILDALNIIDNEENNRILTKQGVSDVNIANEREIIFRKLKQEDYSNITRSRPHVTRGEYDKKKSIELLLTVDDSVCSILKNITIMLRFEWEYTQFC